MPEHVRTNLLVALGAVTMVWYFICLVGLGRRPTGPNPTAFRQFQGLSVTTISTVLATFVGLFLGIQVVKSETEQGGTDAKQAADLVAKADRAVAAAPGPLAADRSVVTDTLRQAKERADAAAAAGTGFPVQWFHYVAFGLYLGSLGLGLYFWGVPPAGGDPDPAVVGLGRSTLGVLIGGLSGLLAIGPTS